MRDEKLHAVVARSTFRCQNVQSTPGPDQFWKLRCRKSARRCGAKHMHAVVARSTFRSQNVQNTPGPLLDVQMSFRVAGLRDCAPFQK